MKSFLLILSILSLNSLCGKAAYQKSNEVPVIFHCNPIDIYKSNGTGKRASNLDTTKFVYAEFVYQESFIITKWVAGKAVSNK